MIRSMYATGSSAVAAASCRTCSLTRLAAPLGRPAPGRFPPCPFIVRSRLIETRGPCVPYPVHLYHNTVQRAARNVQRGMVRFSLIKRSTIRLKENLLVFLPPRPFHEGCGRGQNGVDYVNTFRLSIESSGQRLPHRRFNRAEQPNKLHPFIWR